MKKVLRKIHRWLGLLMALQILAWMISGFYFAWSPIGEIRGEHLALKGESLEHRHLEDLASPAEAWDIVEQNGDGEIELLSIRLERRMDETWYRISFKDAGGAQLRMVNAASLELMTMLTAELAAELARASIRNAGTPLSVTLVDSVEPGSEIRGRDLPVWQVVFESPEGVVVYLQPWSGEVLARRTDRWRIFDFLWMLHIMDFDERDDFNTPLLQWAAFLGLVIALSGLAYWAMTTRLFRGRRRPKARAGA